jgi:hypothetical protein
MSDAEVPIAALGGSHGTELGYVLGGERGVALPFIMNPVSPSSVRKRTLGMVQ